MDKTVRFYRDVLGMQLVGAVGNVPGSYPYRHYFFEIGPNATIAFFEWPGMVEEFHKPAGQPFQGKLQFDHVSFDVETEDELVELQTQLEKAGVEVTEVIDHKFIHSIYFSDPNGIALEASVWITNPTGHEPAEQACGPPDLHATIFHALGIDPDHMIYDADNRPLPLCDGKPLPLF